MPRTPEQIERSNRQRREKRANDPEYRARVYATWNEKYGAGTEGGKRRNAQYRARRALDPEAARKRERASNIKRAYGLHPEEFDLLLDRQGGRCAICLTDTPGSRDWHVDHDHQSGRVRGLLCHGCNTGLGLFAESTDRLEAAISYLQETGNVPLTEDGYPDTFA